MVVSSFRHSEYRSGHSKLTGKKMKASRPSVIIVGHGSSTSKNAEEAANIHAEALRQSEIYSTVVVHFLTEQDLPADLPSGEVFIFPFFMSEGYFVKSKITDVFELENCEHHSAERDIYQCPALGVDPAITDVLLRMGGESCALHGYSAADVDIVLLAHGSVNSPASRRATETHMKSLTELNVFKSVSSAFLEEAPRLDELIFKERRAEKVIIVIGLFAAEGPHAMDDVPEILAQIGDRNLLDSGRFFSKLHYAGVVGVRPEIVELIQNSVLSRSMVK